MRQSLFVAGMCLILVACCAGCAEDTQNVAGIDDKIQPSAVETTSVPTPDSTQVPIDFISYVNTASKVILPVMNDLENQLPLIYSDPTYPVQDLQAENTEFGEKAEAFLNSLDTIDISSEYQPASVAFRTFLFQAVSGSDSIAKGTENFVAGNDYLAQPYLNSVPEIFDEARKARSTALSLIGDLSTTEETPKETDTPTASEQSDDDFVSYVNTASAILLPVMDEMVHEIPQIHSDIAYDTSELEALNDQFGERAASYLKGLDKFEISNEYENALLPFRKFLSSAIEGSDSLAKGIVNVKAGNDYIAQPYLDSVESTFNEGKEYRREAIDLIGALTTNR